MWGIKCGESYEIPIVKIDSFFYTHFCGSIFQSINLNIDAPPCAPLTSLPTFLLTTSPSLFPPPLTAFS